MIYDDKGLMLSHLRLEVHVYVTTQRRAGGYHQSNPRQLTPHCDYSVHVRVLSAAPKPRQLVISLLVIEHSNPNLGALSVLFFCSLLSRRHRQI